MDEASYEREFKELDRRYAFGRYVIVLMFTTAGLLVLGGFGGCLINLGANTVAERDGLGVSITILVTGASLALSGLILMALLDIATHVRMLTRRLAINRKEESALE